MEKRHSGKKNRPNPHQRVTLANRDQHVDTEISTEKAILASKNKQEVVDEGEKVKRK